MNELRERDTGMPSCCKKKMSLQIPRLQHILRRVSLCPFQKGSFIVEASLILPFFLCTVMVMLSLYLQTASGAQDYRSLMEKAEKMAVTLGQKMETDPYVKLYNPAMATVRAWIGYTEERFLEGDAEAIVYMTPEGEVWHRSCDCNYLRLSVRTVTYAALEEMRNRSGEIYAACESCVTKNWKGISVYITDYGSSYHSRRNCRGLKRTVMAVPWSQVRGIRACSKCG